MPTAPRLLLATLPALALGACFDPLLDPDSAIGADSASEGSTSEAGTTDLGTTTDPTEANADSTGAADAPPVITAFTVNSSTMPAELQVAGMVTFDVDAMDDVGIDHVEIYDGDTLVVTTTEIPYVTELLVTSADNGSHSYAAVVYDTAGQTVESEAVPLSVNVVGGAMLTLREDIGDVQIALLGIGEPKLAILPDEDVLVTGMARLEASPEIRTGLLVRGYTDGLSLLWSDEHAPPAGDSILDYAGFSAPSVTSGKVVYVGGVAELATGANDLTAFALDPRTGALTSTSSLWSVAGNVLPLPVAAGSGESLFATASFSEVASYSQGFVSEHWRASSLGEGALEITATPQGEVMVLFIGNDCAPGAGVCLCKLSAAGDVLWTRGVAEDAELGLPTRPAVSSDGHSAVASPADDGSLSIVVFDGQGNELASLALDAGEPALLPRSIAYTPSGDLVVVAASTVLEASTAWAMRVREDGGVLWEQTYAIGGSESVASGVAVMPNGRLYATGHADRYDLDFLSYGAHAWVAELAL